jgi:fatty-acyl-CoA synthase
VTSRQAPATIVAALESAASNVGDRGFSYYLEDGLQRESYEEMLLGARRGAGALAAWGVEPGDAVGVLGPNRPEWVRWALSSWLRGAVVVPMSFGMQISDLGDYVARIRSLVDTAGCVRVMTDPRFLPALPDDVGVAWDTPVPATDGNGLVDSAPEDLAVLQFTSGSTSAPKSAMLTHGAVLACISGFQSAVAIDERDVPLSWLPFFHDNGLFGHLLAPIVTQLENHVLPTERFARNPALWFRLATEVGATLTSGPYSAWAVALKATLRNPDGIDLSALRMAIFGAEAIDPAVIDRYAEHAAELHLRPGSLAGAYGLAEATLIVSCEHPGSGMRMDEVDLHSLADEGRATPVSQGGESVRRVASCGRCMPGTRIRIMGSDGVLPERRVGEIQILGPTVMNGYRGLADADQPFTVDGWLQTGDLGYVADEELFMTGRSKDMIIVFGRNYAPEEFEWLAAQVPGVRPGRCVAFSRPGEGEGELVIVFEPAPGADPEAVASELRRKVNRSLGVAVGDVVSTVKGTITKTTSGKLRRGAMRDAYARGEVLRVPGPDAAAEAPAS